MVCGLARHGVAKMVHQCGGHAHRLQYRRVWRRIRVRTGRRDLIGRFELFTQSHPFVVTDRRPKQWSHDVLLVSDVVAPDPDELL